MDMLLERADLVWQQTLAHLGSPEFYAQIGIVIVALILAWLIASLTTVRVRFFREEPHPGLLLDVRKAIYSVRKLILPTMAAVALSIATPISADLLGEAWLVRVAQGLALIFLIYSLANHFIKNDTIIVFLKWLGIPIAVLYTFGWLDDAINYLESVSLDIGNISISLYAITRTIVFGRCLILARPPIKHYRQACHPEPADTRCGYTRGHSQTV